MWPRLVNEASLKTIPLWQRYVLHNRRELVLRIVGSSRCYFQRKTTIHGRTEEPHCNDHHETESRTFNSPQLLHFARFVKFSYYSTDDYWLTVDCRIRCTNFTEDTSWKQMMDSFEYSNTVQFNGNSRFIKWSRLRYSHLFQRNL